MVDLSAPMNQKMFEDALTTCRKALTRGWIQDDVKKRFIAQMTEEYQVNGFLFEPTTKQFNWLRQIAIDVETP